MRSYLAIALLVLLVLPAILVMLPAYHASPSGIGIHLDFPHARVVVTYVVDGDTVHISPPVQVAGSPRFVVRLADIDAPEVGTPEGDAARQALINLLSTYSPVIYLDIDKSVGVDDYGRIIAVAYVRVNATHLLNVNLWLVVNGYATISDYPNDFDPSFWKLYIKYPIEKEKLPNITRIPLCENCNINYNTSWGVRVAVTPDGNYIGIAYSDYGDPWALHVRIFDKDGNLVNYYDFTPDKGIDWYANVFRGMIDIAANETGFLVAWTNYTRTVGTATTDRTVLFSFVPITGTPTTPMHIYHGSYQYHPTVTFYEHADGTKWWIVGYSSQLSSESRYVIYLLNLTPAYTTEYKNYVIYKGSPSSAIRIGIDVMGKLIYDPVSKRFHIVARGYNYNGTSLHDMLGIYGSVYYDETSGTYNITDPTFYSPYCIDCREGDQGPPASMTGSYSYYNVYPIHTALLRSGRYLLTVYNDTSVSLAYAIVDLNATLPSLIVRANITSLDTSATFYPWIAASDSEWLVAWSALGWTNLTLLDLSGVLGLWALADINSGYARPVYDPATGIFAIPYAVTHESPAGPDRNAYIALFNRTKGAAEPWVLPIAVAGGVPETPVIAAVLAGGSPGRIALITVEGGNLVLNIVAEGYASITSPETIEIEFSISDPEGDDKGIGTIVYPTNPVFVPGAFDLLGFRVLMDDNYVYFRVTVRNLTNPWNGPNGFSLQYIHIYLLTTADLPKQITTYGLNVLVAHGWHYAILAALGWGDTPVPSGQVSALYRYDLRLIADEYNNQTVFDVYASADPNTVEVKVSRTLIADTANIDKWAFVVAIAGYDGYSPTKVRGIKSGDPDQWTFGGGDQAALDAGVHPMIIDLLAPTADSQYAMLRSYDTTTGQLAKVSGVTSTGEVYTPPPTATTVTATQTATETVTQTATVTFRETVTSPVTLTETATITVTGTTVAATTITATTYATVPVTAYYTETRTALLEVTSTRTVTQVQTSTSYRTETVTATHTNTITQTATHVVTQTTTETATETAIVDVGPLAASATVAVGVIAAAAFLALRRK